MDNLEPIKPKSPGTDLLRKLRWPFIAATLVMLGVTFVWAWQMSLATVLGGILLFWAMSRAEDKPVFYRTVQVLAAGAFLAALASLVLEAGFLLLGVLVFALLALNSEIAHEEIETRVRLDNLGIRSQ
jgi:membrane-bound ClpP family serine protease